MNYPGRIPDHNLRPLGNLAGAVNALVTSAHPALPEDCLPNLYAGQDALTGRAPSLAAQYGVQILRLAGTTSLERDDDDVPMWAHVLDGTAETLLAGANHRRRYALASELRHAWPGIPRTPMDEYGDDVARWLVASGDNDEAACAAKFVRRLLQDERLLRGYAVPAWWTVHGADVAETLGLADAPGTPGRPADSEFQARRREVALGMMSARHWSKSAVARRVGISRPTLDFWIADDTDPLGSLPD